MTEPWLDDACSLVEAFRAGTLSPTEALDASLEAIAASELNAVCHVDEEAARAAAADADVSLPFGGVPLGVKELDHVAGWPDSEALVRDAGLRRVDVVVELPQGGLEWALSNLVGLVAELGDRFPACNDDLTPEIQIGMNLATHHYSIESAGKAELSLAAGPLPSNCRSCAKVLSMVSGLRSRSAKSVCSLVTVFCKRAACSGLSK